MTSKFCLAQLGQAIKLIPFFLNLKDLKISKPTLISSHGSEAKETLIVSPIPSERSCPIAIEDLIVPLLSPPASVTVSYTHLTLPTNREV